MAPSGALYKASLAMPILTRSGSGHSRRMRSARFSGACPLLPESNSQPTKVRRVVKGHSPTFRDT